MTFLPRTRLLTGWLGKEGQGDRASESGGLGGPRITLLLAPAGYGKSVLLEQLTSRLERAVRVDLREGQGDAHSLVSALADALDGLDAGVAGALRAGNRERPLSAFRAARELAGLSAGMFVLDHAERLELDGEAWLLAFMRALPAQHRLVVAGRALQSYELPLLVASGTVRVLGPDELAFDEQEVQALTEQQGAGAADLASLKGWPLAVRLSLSGAYGQSVGALLRAMLRALPGDLQGMLPHLAPYDRWTPALPATLGFTVPADWQDTLMKSSLPVLAAPDGQAAPHEALLDVLDEQLRLDQGAWQARYREAANVALRQDRALRGMELLRRAGLHTEALELARHTAPLLARRGQFGLLSQLLGSLPPELLRGGSALGDSALSHSALSHSALGDTALAVLYGTSLIETERIQAGMTVLEGVAGRPEGWLALPELAFGNFMLSRLDDAQAHIEEARPLFGQFDLAGQLRLRLVEGALLRQRGQNEQSLTVLQEGVALARAHADPMHLALLLSSLNVTYFRLNRSEEALSAIHEALNLYEELGAFHRMTQPLVNLAVSYRSRDELTKSLEVLRRAEQFESLHQSRGMTSILFGLANTYQLQGDFEQAVTAFLKCLSRAQVTGRVDFEYMAALLLSETYRGLGQNELANRALNLAEQLLAQEPQLQANHVLALLIRFMQGQRALAAGRLDEAQALLEQFPVGVGSIAAWYPRARLLLALIAWQRGELTPAHLEEFLTRHRMQEGVAYLTPDLLLVQPVLHAAVERGWFADELRPFLRAAPRSRHRLQVQTLGRPGIHLNGRPLVFRGRNVVRARELLALLGLLPPPTSQELRRLLIGEGRGDHRNVLTTLRQTLRDATGLSEPLVQDEQRRYVLHPDLDIRTDIDDLRRALHTRHAAELRRLLAQGEFLPGFTQDWVLDLREEEVTPLCVQAYLELGTQATENRDYPEALHWYGLALQLDPAQERAARTSAEIHRSLLTAPPNERPNDRPRVPH